MTPSHPPPFPQPTVHSDADAEMAEMDDVAANAHDMQDMRDVQDMQDVGRAAGYGEAHDTQDMQEVQDLGRATMGVQHMHDKAGGVGQDVQSTAGYGAGYGGAQGAHNGADLPLPSNTTHGASHDGATSAAPPAPSLPSHTLSDPIATPTPAHPHPHPPIPDSVLRSGPSPDAANNASASGGVVGATAPDATAAVGVTAVVAATAIGASGQGGYASGRGSGQGSARELLPGAPRSSAGLSGSGGGGGAGAGGGVNGGVHGAGDEGNNNLTPMERQLRAIYGWLRALDLPVDEGVGLTDLVSDGVLLVRELVMLLYVMMVERVDKIG